MIDICRNPLGRAKKKKNPNLRFNIKKMPLSSVIISSINAYYLNKEKSHSTPKALLIFFVFINFCITVYGIASRVYDFEEAEYIVFLTQVLAIASTVQTGRVLIGK